MKLKFKGKSIRILTVISAVALTVVVVVGSTVAWITDATEVKVNTFIPAAVTCEVSESFDNIAKSNVQIKNTSNIDAYIRVALVPAWKDGNGNIANVSASLDDCNIQFGENLNQNWIKGEDGLYYCKVPVAQDSMTPVLIESCTVKNLTNPDLQFELQVVATAIQSKPTVAVTQAWGVTLQDEMIVSKGAA